MKPQANGFHRAIEHVNGAAAAQAGVLVMMALGFVTAGAWLLAQPWLVDAFSCGLLAMAWVMTYHIVQVCGAYPTPRLHRRAHGPRRETASESAQVKEARDVISALVNLGYTQEEVLQAVLHVPEHVTGFDNVLRSSLALLRPRAPRA